MTIHDYDFVGKRVFISGPMTGYEDWNRAAFADAECMLRKAKTIEVFNPAADAPAGEDCHSHEHWMLRTLRELTRMIYASGDNNNRSHWDCILMLPGWEASAGSCVEHDVAEACGIDIVELQPTQCDIVVEKQDKECDLEPDYKTLKARYETVLALLGGAHVVLDFFKDGDVCHVVTTDGEEVYDYQKWLDGHVPVYDKYSREISEIAREYERVCGGTCAECEHANPNYPEEDDEMCSLAFRLKVLLGDE